MKRTFIYPALLLSLGLFAASGCAKKEMIKKDEMIPTARSEHTPTKTAETAAADQSPAPKQAVATNATENQTAPELRRALDSIYFSFDSAGLDTAARDILEKTYQTMKGQSGIKLRIEGNCDERGSEEYNIALGEKRAKAAKKYLSTMGIDAGRLSTISYGKDKPAATGHDEAAWEKNRRDDFVIVSR